MSAGQPVLEHVRLEGERVRLRPLCAGDAAAAFPLVHGRREVLDWLVWEGPESPEELAAAYQSWATLDDDGANYHLALEELAGGELCGTIGARFKGHPFQADVGYWIGSRYWGRGLATEAVRLVAHLCFEHLRAVIVYACVFVGNEASARVLAKNGFEEVAIGDQGEGGIFCSRAGRPQRFFALARSAWGARRTDFQPLREDVGFAGRR